MLYGAETWRLSRHQANKLLAIYMDFWCMAAWKSRKEKIMNLKVRKQNIIEEIEEKLLKWLGHLKRMRNNRIPKKWNRNGMLRAREEMGNLGTSGWME